MTEQKVIWYPNYWEAKDIQKCMQDWIEDGWRIHTCLNKSSDVLVIYEREVVK